MPLKLKSGCLTSTGSEGLLFMDSGAGDQVVHVTLDALKAVADPPRADDFRLQTFIEAFSTIASRKFDSGLFDETGHIKVEAADALEWRASQL